MCALDLGGYLFMPFMNKNNCCPLSEHSTTGVLLDNGGILSQSAIFISCFDMYLLCNIGSCFSLSRCIELTTHYVVENH